MANKQLFTPSGGRRPPPTNTTNLAGGTAYSLPAAEALAQFACTGCLNSTFYASAETQLTTVLDLARQCDPSDVARIAIYARHHAHMRDMPVLLLAYLSVVDKAAFRSTFSHIITNLPLARTFVQIIRSGVVGRRSLGTLPRNLLRRLLSVTSPETLFRSSYGNDPTFADLLRLVRPKPSNPQHAALYAYTLGRPFNRADLPHNAQSYLSLLESLPRSCPPFRRQYATLRSALDDHLPRLPELPYRPSDLRCRLGLVHHPTQAPLPR